MSGSSIARAAMIVVAALATTVPAIAQDTTSCHCVVIQSSHSPNAFQRRSSGTLAFIQSRPQDTFGQNIGFGYGADGTYLFRLDDAGFLGLRADAGLLQYGEESKRVPLSSTIGGRVQVDVSTTNYIVPLSIGPQLMWPRGSIRPYVNGGVGGQFFFTQSSVEGSDDVGSFANTTNQWDRTLTWVAGAGVYVPIYQRRFNVLLDLGAQYVNGGRARYLKPGSIEDLPDSQIRITPMESNTHMVLVRFGVRLGM
jgi:opacity protein-like surface antigen